MTYIFLNCSTTQCKSRLQSTVSLDELKRTAANQGWTIKRHKQFCPSCAKKSRDMMIAAAMKGFQE